MNFEVIIKDDNISELEKEIILTYWKTRDTELLCKPRDIKLNYNLTQHQLITLIKEKSECRIDKGECENCDTNLSYTVYSQSQFKIKVDSSIVHCEECRETFRLQRKNKEKNSKGTTFHNAIVSGSQDHLEFEHIALLKKMIIYEDRNSIFNNIIKPDWEYSWKIINQLERLGIIYIERDINKEVLNFEILPPLKSQIIEILKTENDTLEYNHTTSINQYNRQDAPIQNRLSFSLKPKLNKTEARHPDYSGVFKLPTDVLLKQGVEYVYGAWVLTDGSINLKFTPKEDIFPTINEDLDDQPQSLKSHLDDFLSSLPPTNNFDYDE